MFISSRKKYGLVDISGGADYTIKNAWLDGSNQANNIYGINIRNKSNATILIENCKFTNWNKSASRAIYFDNCTNINLIMRHNYFEKNTCGAQIWDTSFANFLFTQNKCKDQRANNAGGLTALIQLANCGHNANIEVSYNKVQSFPTAVSGAIMGDVINFFMSGGTSGSRAKIKGNWFRANPIARETSGDFKVSTGIQGTFSSGGSCMVVGDSGGNNTVNGGSYIDIEDNIVINYNAFGIQCVNEGGANNHRLYRNKILLETRDEVINSVRTGTWLALQLSSSVSLMQDNWAWCKRWDEAEQDYINNHRFPSQAGISDDPSNLYGQAALDAGLRLDLIPSIIV